MSDDTFTANVNEVGKRFFFFAAPMYDEFSQTEVLVGMAECLSQSLAGAALSPDTIKAVLGAVTSGLAHVGPEFSETMNALAKLADKPARRSLPSGDSK
jgi:hypothetical protein